MIHRINLIAMRTIWLPMSVIAFCIIIVVAWSIDREPPLTYLGKVEVERADAHTIRISYAVKRHRYCDLTVVRFVRDQDGYRWHMTDMDYLAPEIRDIEAANPGRVLLTLPVPAGARRGAMVLRLRLNWYCNPLQVALDWPISLAYSIPFYMEPEPH